MHTFTRSLLVRLTCSYALSLLFMLVAFTGVATLLSFQLADFMNGRLQIADERVSDVTAHLRRPGQSLYDAALPIIAALKSPGIDVDIFDTQRGIGIVHGASVRLDEEHIGRRYFPRPSDVHFERGHQGQVLLTMLLGLHRLEHPVQNGMIILIPHVTELGTPYTIYLAELVFLALATGVVAGIIGFSVTLGAVKPLKQVTEALEYLANGDFRSSLQVHFSQRTEIGELAIAYNKAAASVTKAMAERERAEQQMRQFIADASHELRTPLTVMLCYIEVLKKSAPEEEELRNRIYQTMVVEGYRMRSLVNNLLLLMRMEQDSGRPLRRIDLTELVETAVKPLCALDSQQRIKLELPTEARILGDSDELREAIVNIVDNALKYTTVGDIHIIVDHDQDTAWVSIRDHGEGIPLEEQGAIFERFYRGTQRADIEGSGLGLAIAQRAVQRAGGQIHMTSTPAEGTSFQLTFPLLLDERDERIES